MSKFPEHSDHVVNTIKTAQRRIALEIATREARNSAAAWDAFFAGR